MRQAPAPCFVSLVAHLPRDAHRHNQPTNNKALTRPPILSGDVGPRLKIVELAVTVTFAACYQAPSGFFRLQDDCRRHMRQRHDCRPRLLKNSALFQIHDNRREFCVTRSALSTGCVSNHKTHRGQTRRPNPGARAGKRRRESGKYSRPTSPAPRNPSLRGHSAGRSAPLGVFLSRAA